MVWEDHQGKMITEFAPLKRKRINTDTRKDKQPAKNAVRRKWEKREYWEWSRWLIIAIRPRPRERYVLFVTGTRTSKKLYEKHCAMPG